MLLSGETDNPPYSGSSRKLRLSLLVKRRPYAEKHFLVSFLLRKQAE